ncbi:aspartyl-phosphate phosphatase Spo0E family protein [Neobacillus sp. M.A.Huq-85]
MKQFVFESELLNRINEKRNILLNIAKSTGINSLKTLECSQELDSLLNLYRKLVSEKDIEPSLK